MNWNFVLQFWRWIFGQTECKVASKSALETMMVQGFFSFVVRVRAMLHHNS
jgi:hypothetical protein